MPTWRTSCFPRYRCTVNSPSSSWSCTTRKCAWTAYSPIYEPDFREKLVLPTEPADLVDSLSAEMDVLMENIIEGKPDGTSVLCAEPIDVDNPPTAEICCWNRSAFDCAF